MTNYQFRPLTAWPRPLTRNRQHSRFDSTYTQTLKLLERELTQVEARNVVIQLALHEADIRRDGLPRAQARPEHPGVILSFEKRGEWNGAKRGYDYMPLSFPCDTYLSWEENLRAIALALEALRKVDRYGVTQTGEQYQGWTALPSPAPDAIATRQQAAEFISQHSGIVVTALATDAESLKRAYRKCAAKLHPDAGGQEDQFIKLKRALEVLSQ